MPGRQHQHDRVRADRHQVDPRVQLRAGEVGGRDDHVHLAAAKCLHALVRLQLQQDHLDIRVALPEPGHRRHRERVDRALKHREGHRTGRLVTQAPQLRLGGVHLRQDLPRPPGQDHAGRGQAHPSAGALQKLAAGFSFEHAELLGHGRGAQVGVLGDGSHGAVRLQIHQKLQPQGIQGHIRDCTAELNSSRGFVRWT
jgi:hypothetical protein